MTRRLVTFTCAMAIAGCAHVERHPDPAYAESMAQSGERYMRCVTEETKREAKSPAASEEIAVAAHARCWAAWDAYRTATHASFTAAARSPEELQYGRDKADAHLRQFELETRRSVMESVVQSTFK
jgi:hypothetical protein